MLLICLFILILILSYQRRDNNLDLRILFIICFSLLSIILSYRAADFRIYKGVYEKMEPLNRVIIGENDFFLQNPDNFEIGYVFLNSFFKMFSPYIEIFYIGATFFILFLVLDFFNNKSLNFYKLFLPYFAFFFITVQVGIIRQAIAIAIFFFCVKYIVQGKSFRYLIGTIISCLFHSSAIILPPLYFLVRKRYASWLLISLYILGLAIFVQIIPFSIMGLMQDISGFLFPSIGDKLTFYIWQLDKLEAPSKFNFGIFENSAMVFLLISIRSNLTKKNLWDSFMNICFNFSMLYIYLYIYIFEFSNAIYRINYYFVFFKFFVLVKYIESLEGSNKRLIGHMILTLYCFMMLIIRILQGY